MTVKLGIAFGGGGARAGAHIGVMQELDRLGLRPDLVTGTSAGGLVASLIACGISTDDILALFQQFNLRLFSWAGTGAGLIGTAKFEERLEALIGRPTFADLEIPLSLIATNLNTQQEVILDQGDLISAILATTAYPVLFPPVERDGLILVDGGVVNNVPFDVARARGATYVMAIDLSNADPYGVITETAPDGSSRLIDNLLQRTKQRPLWQVVTAVSDIIVARNSRARLGVSPPDLMLRPYMGSIGLFDFQALEPGIAAGRAAAQEVEEELRTLLTQD